VRAGTTANSAGYFVLSTGNDPASSVIFFFARSTGFFYVNADVGGNESFPYNALQWYHVEFKNLDWTAKNFDYYVDGELIQADVPFRRRPSPTTLTGSAFIISTSTPTPGGMKSAWRVARRR
jgi:hypothetical protein